MDELRRVGSNQMTQEEKVEGIEVSEKPETGYHRPTELEIEQRVDDCRKMMGLGYRDGQIKKAVAKKYDMSPRSVERYLRRARDQMREELGKSREDLRAESAEVYREVVRNADSFDARIKAQTRIDKLYGLESPLRHEHSGPEGSPIEVSRQDEEDAVAEIASRLGMALDN